MTYIRGLTVSHHCQGHWLVACLAPSMTYEWRDRNGENLEVSWSYIFVAIRGAGFSHSSIANEKQTSIFTCAISIYVGSVNLRLCKFSWTCKTKLPCCHGFNTLRPRQHRRRFADDIFKCIFLNENCCVLIKNSLKYVRKVPSDNNPAFVQIMAWRRLGDKPLSEAMMVILQMHICVTRPQWVKKRQSG